LPRRCSRLNFWFRILEQELKAAAGPCYGGRQGTQAAPDSTEDIQCVSFDLLSEIPTDDDRLGSVARLFESTRQPERRHSPGFTGAVQSFLQVLSGRGSQGVAPQRPQHTVRVATGVGVSGVGTASRTSDKAGYRIRNRRLCMDSVCVPASPVRRAPICRLAPRMEGRRKVWDGSTPPVGWRNKLAVAASEWEDRNLEHEGPRNSRRLPMERFSNRSFPTCVRWLGTRRVQREWSGYLARQHRGSLVVEIGYRGYRPAIVEVGQAFLCLDRPGSRLQNWVVSTFERGCLDVVHAPLCRVQIPGRVRGSWIALARAGVLGPMRPAGREKSGVAPIRSSG